MSKTVEVPVVWLEKLVELRKSLDQNPNRLPLLKGYIESAKMFIEQEVETK